MALLVRRIVNIISVACLVSQILSLVWTHTVFGFFTRKKGETWKLVINLTKYNFLSSLISCLSNTSGADITITYDAETLPEGKTFKKTLDGLLSMNLFPNSVIMSNHQLYVDWCYVWYLTYLSNLSDTMHIVLKEALARIPFAGKGMINFNFMFLSRKWEHDKIVLTNQLLEIDADARGSGPASGVELVASETLKGSLGNIKTWPKESLTKKLFPYEVLIFPEGTVPSIRTKSVSNSFCEKIGRPPLKHVLLPRARGLFLVLHKLRNTVEIVYDITTGYSDLTADECAEDKFTLTDVFINGKSPKTVNFHIRTFKLSEIPLGDGEIDFDDINNEQLRKFEDWLYNIWYEKDAMMDNFFKYGTFVEPGVQTETVIKGKMKLRNKFQSLTSYCVPLLTLNLIYLLYILARFFV